MQFDYIIIGAGSAGCVLANRLTENGSDNVLLLEAGSKPNMMISIPGAYSTLHRTKVDWGFWTEPQEHVGDRRLYVPRGKVLGGCSSTNAMAYVRGNAKDYDHWEELGNNGWSYKEVLPYFKKSEHHEEFNNDYHGINGELNVIFSKHPHPLTEAFLKACAEKGIAFNEDYNGRQQMGAGLLQFTIKNNKRHSASEAFLKPILHRKNLTVRTKVYVRKIIIENGKATGVELVTDNKTTETIHCTKEIILSAGAIQSPKILLHSGIGDAALLNSIGIDIKLNLKGVGKNLQDHIWAPTTSLCNIKTANNAIKPVNMVRELLNYLLFKKGPFCNSPIEANAFIKTDAALVTPDIQFHFTPTHVGNDYNHDLYDIKTIPTTNGFAIMNILLHPESRGSVLIKNNDPFEVPVIQPNFLSKEKDLLVLLKGLKKAMEVMSAISFKTFSQGKIDFPLNATNDEELTDHIKKSLETLYHPVGTCKMGSDEMAVVNERLQVHGVKNLRVIDASIMPEIISGNTNAAAIMIAEKGADMVKGTAKESII